MVYLFIRLHMFQRFPEYQQGCPQVAFTSVAQIFLQVLSLGKGRRNERNPIRGRDSQRRAASNSSHNWTNDRGWPLYRCQLTTLTCRIGYPKQKQVVDVFLHELHLGQTQKKLQHRWTGSELSQAKSESLVTTSSRRSRTISWPPMVKNPMDSMDSHHLAPILGLEKTIFRQSHIHKPCVW